MLEGMFLYTRSLEHQEEVSLLHSVVVIDGGEVVRMLHAALKTSVHKFLFVEP